VRASGLLLIGVLVANPVLCLVSDAPPNLRWIIIPLVLVAAVLPGFIALDRLEREVYGDGG
jgi:hypothetical protein